MRKWYGPVALLGLGGFGILLFTRRGRMLLKWLSDNAHRAPEKLLGWNEAAQRELDKVQTALNRVAETLQTGR
jgi:hypothetical protein